jgi:hypothetical protein
MRPGVAILAAAILAMPARALAAEEPNRVAFRLEYTPRPGCIDRETFVNEWLVGEFGHDVVLDDARAFVRVTVKRNGARPEAHVSAFDEKGVEHWHIVIPTTVDCRELMQDVAYSMATNLGKWDLKKQPVPEWLLRWAPLAEVGTPAPSPPPRAFVAMLPPAPRLVRRPMLAQVPASEPAEGTRAQEMRFEFGLAGFIAPSGLPAVGFGGSFIAALRWPRFSLMAEGRGLASLVGDPGGFPTNAVMWLGALAPCVETRLRVSICLLGSAGRVYYVTDALAKHVDTRAFTALLGARIGYGWQPTKTLTVRPFIDGMLPLWDGLLEIEQRGVVKKKLSIGPMLNIGVMFTLDAL